MFEALEQALARAESVDEAALSPTELGDGIKSLSAVCDRAQALRARLIRAFDKQQLFAQSGDTSMTGWLRNNCHLSGGSADGQVQLAPAEGELVAAAKEKDPVELREKVREIRHRVDADAMARLAQEQYRRRRLRVFNLADGMVGVDGALPQAAPDRGRPGREPGARAGCSGSGAGGLRAHLPGDRRAPHVRGLGQRANGRQEG